MHLQVSAISKSFGEGAAAKLVLDRISFDLNAGDFLALVGSSGSGKSTVMRLIDIQCWCGLCKGSNWNVMRRRL